MNRDIIYTPATRIEICNLLGVDPMHVLRAEIHPNEVSVEFVPTKEEYDHGIRSIVINRTLARE